MPPRPSPKLIYIGPNTLFSPNIMIIIMGIFRNTSNTLLLYEMNLFLTGSLAYYDVYGSAESTSNVFHVFNFHCRDLEFSDIVSNTILVLNLN